MTYELLTALTGFAFVSSITPGPNNLMLMASGANFGFRQTIPHMLGVGIGFVLMLIIVGLGLVQIFVLYPVTITALKVLSVVYMLFLAWKIATAAPPEMGEAAGTPMTFLQAAAFQWVNPKAWAMALTAMAAYAPSQTLLAVVWVGGVFGAVNFPSISAWTIMGQKIRKLLASHRHLRVFNTVMAVLLILTLYPVLKSSGFQ